MGKAQFYDLSTYRIRSLPYSTKPMYSYYWIDEISLALLSAQMLV